MPTKPSRALPARVELCSMFEHFGMSELDCVVFAVELARGAVAIKTNFHRVKPKEPARDRLPLAFAVTFKEDYLKEWDHRFSCPSPFGYSQCRADHISGRALEQMEKHRMLERAGRGAFVNALDLFDFIAEGSVETVEVLKSPQPPLFARRPKRSQRRGRVSSSRKRSVA